MTSRALLLAFAAFRPSSLRSASARDNRPLARVGVRPLLSRRHHEGRSAQGRAQGVAEGKPFYTKQFSPSHRGAPLHLERARRGLHRRRAHGCRRAGMRQSPLHQGPASWRAATPSATCTTHRTDIARPELAAKCSKGFGAGRSRHRPQGQRRGCCTSAPERSPSWHVAAPEKMDAGNPGRHQRQGLHEQHAALAHRPKLLVMSNTFVGQVGVSKTLKIGDRAVVNAQSGCLHRSKAEKCISELLLKKLQKVKERMGETYPGNMEEGCRPCYSQHNHKIATLLRIFQIPSQQFIR